MEEIKEEELNSCCASSFCFTKKTGNLPKRKDATPKINKTDEVQAGSFENNKNADTITKPPLPKNKQVNNTGQELKPVSRSKEPLKNRKIENLNCNEFPVETNEPNKIIGTNLKKKAEVPFRNGPYDKAEHSGTVCNAKAQNNPNVRMKAKKNYNERATDHILDEKFTQYNECLKVAQNANDNGDLPKAVHFIRKANRINPNDGLLNFLKRLEESISKSDTLVEPIETTEERRKLTKFERTYPTAKADQRKQVEENSGEVVRDRENISIEKAGEPSSQLGRKVATSEQIYEINRVLKASDDYDILSKFTKRIQIIHLFNDIK